MVETFDRFGKKLAIYVMIVLPMKFYVIKPLLSCCCERGQNPLNGLKLCSLNCCVL